MEPTTYTIGGRTFEQRDLVWGQIKWLYQRLKGLPLDDLRPDMMAPLLHDHLSAMCAIALIPEGMTQADKVAAGPAAVQELETWLDGHLTPDDAAAVLKDFFDSGQIGKLMTGLATMAPPIQTSGSAIS